MCRLSVKCVLFVLLASTIMTKRIFALETIVLDPINNSGTDVAFIMVPGAYVSGEQYEDLGVALQNASPHRLWVALTTGYTDNLVNPIELDDAIDLAIVELIVAGMPESTQVFVAGHSLGGVLLKSYVHDNAANTAGMILYGSYFQRGELPSFPVPTLTLSGDLDGLTRITRIAVQFNELMSYVQNNSDGALRFPTVIVNGVNHGQYFTGDIPSRVQEFDITPEIDGPTARQTIAEATVDFLIRTAGVPEARLPDATNNLARFYQENEIRMKPIIDVFALENINGSSEHSINAQRVISGLPRENWDRLVISNTVRESGDYQFVEDKPTLEIRGNQAIIGTFTDVVKPENDFDVSTINESASRIAVKMKNANSLQEELGGDLRYNTSVSCTDANKMAYDVARDLSSSLALRRFSAMNYTINFAEDDSVDIGPEFLLGDLIFSKNGKSIVIQSTGLKTSTDVPVRDLAGHYYCQIISPARLLEFMYVDGLRG